MQKTITINGKRYTGKQIAKLMDASKVEREDGMAKFVTFGQSRPIEYCCEYRHDDNDGYFAPIVKYQREANCIKIECRTFSEPPVWIEL